MTHQLLPSCTAPGTDVVLFIGDSVCLLIAYTEWKYPELDPLNVMRYLHGHTWGRTVHTQFWILLQITNNNKKGTHMLPRGCSCYGDSLFGVRPIFGRRAVWMNLVFRKSLDMTSSWVKKKHVGFSAWGVCGPLAHRYAWMTNVPFSTLWCNEFGVHTD